MGFFDFSRIPIYALDISDQSFKFLHLIDFTGGMVVESFGEGAIDKGVLENGEIKDSKKFTDILKNVFYKNNIKFVALSLPEEKGFLREVKISGVKENELSSALEFQIEEHIPLPAAEIYFEYKVAERGSDYFNVVINAFPKSIVESYLDVVSSSGALPVFLESETESVARSIIPKNFVKPTMIIDWGKTRASFSIFENGVLKFASTASVGGELLDNAISKSFNVSKSKALEIKFNANISSKETPPEIMGVILPVVSLLREEIKKILNYWQDRPDKRADIKQVFLSGGDSNLFGLSEYLTEELGIFTTLANPWVNVKFPPRYFPSLKYRDSLRFSSAIGISLKAKKEEKFI